MAANFTKLRSFCAERAEAPNSRRKGVFHTGHWRNNSQRVAQCRGKCEAGIRMDCVFCKRHHPILAETKLSFAFLDSFPVSSGHSLVIPKRHVLSIWELTDEEYTDAFNLVRQVKDILQEKFEPQGYNVGVNCGEAAGQSVFHAHVHVIPRYNGDVPSPRGGVRNIIPGKGNY
jgi:diadenosine tetraphosphate (Ap4A) HIT family hydrolase